MWLNPSLAIFFSVQLRPRRTTERLSIVPGIALAAEKFKILEIFLSPCGFGVCHDNEEKALTRFWPFHLLYESNVAWLPTLIPPKGYDFDSFAVEEEHCGWTVYETSFTGEVSGENHLASLWRSAPVRRHPINHPVDVCVQRTAQSCLSKTYLRQWQWCWREASTPDVVPAERDKPCGKEEPLWLSLSGWPPKIPHCMIAWRFSSTRLLHPNQSKQCWGRNSVWPLLRPQQHSSTVFVLASVRAHFLTQIAHRWLTDFGGKNKIAERVATFIIRRRRYTLFWFNLRCICFPHNLNNVQMGQLVSSM